MGSKNVSSNSIEQIASKKEGKVFRVTAVNGDVRIAERKRLAKTGDLLQEGQQTTYQLEGSDDLYAYNDSSAEAKLEINPRGLIVVGRNNTIQQTAQRQFDSGQTGQDTVSTGGNNTALNGGTGLQIPRGSQLAVRAATGNNGPVYIGFDSSVDDTKGFELPAGSGLSIPVDDVSDIYFYANNNGDSVSWEVETQ